jgi:hypothetical protein
MSKVLLVVTFRSHHQFTSDPNENRLPLVKQLIDIADAGTLVNEADHPECFTFSLPCEIDLSTAQGAVALNLVNDKVAVLIRHISNALPDAVIIASAGSLIKPEHYAAAAVKISAVFQTALSLLGEIASILSVDSLQDVASPALTDCMKRINLFLDEHDKDRSAQGTTDGSVKSATP